MTPPHKGDGNSRGARATGFPPPSCRRRVFDTMWGRDREGRNRQPLPSGLPPPLAPPREGEGNPSSAVAGKGG